MNSLRSCSCVPYAHHSAPDEEGGKGGWRANFPVLLLQFLKATGYLASENLCVEYSIVIFTLVTAQTVLLLLMTYLNILLV